MLQEVGILECAGFVHVSGGDEAAMCSQSIVGASAAQTLASPHCNVADPVAHAVSDWARRSIESLRVKVCLPPNHHLSLQVPDRARVYHSPDPSVVATGRLN